MRGFNGPQIGLAAVLARTGTDEFLVTQDAVHGAFAHGQLEHVH